MLIRKRRGWEIPEREAAPEGLYFGRRALLKGMGFVGAQGLLGRAFGAVAPDLYPAKRVGKYTLDRPVTPEFAGTGYNNFYEFTLDKQRVKDLVEGFETEPWKVEVKGLCNNPKTYGNIDGLYDHIDDLKGKKLAFADPNSTSGHQAPRYFLTEAGYDPDKHFGSTAFSGSHENSIVALMNGTFDAAATWYRSEERSNMTRMEGKKMIKPDQWRIVWKSPRLPSSPWAMSTKMPADMRTDVKNALLNMKKDDPAAWKALTDGKASAYREVTHKEYEAIVRMIKENLRKRKAS